MIYPVNPAVATGGVGLINMTVDLADPATGGSYAGPPLMATGMPTTVRFIRDNGDVHVPDINVIVGSDQVLYTIPSGLPAGSYACLSNGLDPAVRNADGGWVGTLYDVATVT